MLDARCEGLEARYDLDGLGAGVKVRAGWAAANPKLLAIRIECMNSQITEQFVKPRGIRPEIYLGYLGLLPFIYLALGLPLLAGVVQVSAFLAYSAIILAFMAGTVWRHSPASNSASSSIFSNVLAIAAFLLLLAPIDPQAAIFILALLYVLLLMWEWSICRQSYPRWYWQLRLQLSFIVLALHSYMLYTVFSV